MREWGLEAGGGSASGGLDADQCISVETGNVGTPVRMVDDCDRAREELCFFRDFEVAIDGGVDLDLQRPAGELVHIDRERNVICDASVGFLIFRCLFVLLEVDPVAVAVDDAPCVKCARDADVVCEKIFVISGNHEGRTAVDDKSGKLCFILKFDRTAGRCKNIARLSIPADSQFAAGSNGSAVDNGGNGVPILNVY